MTIIDFVMLIGLSALIAIAGIFLNLLVISILVINLSLEVRDKGN